MIYDIQKANMWKRISAYLFDFILLCIAAVGIAFLLSLALNFQSHSDARDAMRNEYEVKYGVDFDIKQADFDALSEEEKKNFEEAYRAFVTDPEVNNKDLLLINLSMMITSFGILFSYLVLEVFIPIKLKNGQTLGKKIFGIAVMRADGVRLSTLQLLVRTVLGKYAIETMIPVFLILLFLFNYMTLFCVVGLAVILIMQIIFVATTQHRTPIHDAIAGTVTVDMASQLIFDTPEALTEYKKRVHAEAADKAEYK